MEKIGFVMVMSGVGGCILFFFGLMVKCFMNAFSNGEYSLCVALVLLALMLVGFALGAGPSFACWIESTWAGFA